MIRKIQYIFVLLLFCTQSFLFGQENICSVCIEKGVTYHRAESYEQSLKNFREAYVQCKKINDWHNSIKASLYELDIIWKEKRLDKISQLIQRIDLDLQNHNTNLTPYLYFINKQSISLFKAKFESLMGNQNEVKKQFNLILQELGDTVLLNRISASAPNAEAFEIYVKQRPINICKTIASIFQQQQAYETALEYYFLSLNYCRPYLKEAHQDGLTVQNYLGISECQLSLGNYAEVEKYTNRADTLIQKYNLLDIEFPKRLQIIQAKLNVKKSNYAIALSHLKNLETEVIHQANAYELDILEAHILFKMNESKKAISLLKQAMKQLNKLNPDKYAPKSEVYKSIVENFMNIEKFDSAKYYVAKGIENLLPDDFKPEKDTLPANRTLAELFHLDAKILSQYSNSEENLVQANQSNNQAIKINSDIRSSMFYEREKIDLIEANYNYFEKSMDLEYNLYQLNGIDTHVQNMFEIAEKSKAINLREAVWRNIQNNVLPDSTRALLQTITLRIRQISTQFDLSTKPDEKSNLYREKHILQKQSEEIRNNITPELIIQNKTHSIENTIQLALEENQNLISYFYGSSNIYALFSNGETKNVKLICSVEEFNLLNESFQQSIKTKNRETFIQYANQLYQILVEPFDISSSRLLIIPDGPIGFIPFSALLESTENLSFQKLPYLLRKHAVSYSYSLDLLLANQNERKKKSCFLGFAPEFNNEQVISSNDRSTDGFLKPLKYNIEEVESISQKMKGEIFLGHEASLSKFKEVANQCDILHLGTHALVNSTNSDSSFIAFTDQHENFLLYEKDIYDLNISADMVVLSACETGTGKIKQGEGVFSLSRAFLYTGTRSIISSLWNINDQTSKDIMISYYHELEKGKSKDIAMQNAQLNYLDNESPHFKAPYYWAAFIPIGNMTPLNNSFPYEGIVMLGCIGFVLYLFRKKIKFFSE